jgi:multisubunit Na+/H+ antiporter MnhF subunit
VRDARDAPSVPSAVVIALFAFLATWVVARYGLRQRQGREQ